MTAVLAPCALCGEPVHEDGPENPAGSFGMVWWHQARQYLHHQGSPSNITCYERWVTWGLRPQHAMGLEQ